MAVRSERSRKNSTRNLSSDFNARHIVKFTTDSIHFVSFDAIEFGEVTQFDTSLSILWSVTGSDLANRFTFH